MSYDAKLFLAAFGSQERLSYSVSDAASFIENRHETVLGFSDQIPLWISSEGGPKVFHCSEVTKNKAMRQEQAEGRLKGCQVQELLSHKRDAGFSEETRFRITVEARQLVRKFFSKDFDEEPEAQVYKTLVVVPGVHCRLSNISEDGRWLADESFSYGGELIERKKGESVGVVAKRWRALRTAHPELFQNLSLMQQPSAFVDSVIFTWSQLELAKEIPQAVWQRDLFQAAFSESARSATSLAQSISAWIAGKMTPVLQLTDTDYAQSFKAACRREEKSLRQEIKHEFKVRGERGVPKMGAYELLRIVDAGHASQIRRQSKDNFIIGGLRRNMMLSYRPDFSAGRLRRTDEAAWAKKFPEGSERIQSGWSKDRYEWLDEHGVPHPMEWQASEDAKEEAMRLEADYCQAEAERDLEADLTLEDVEGMDAETASLLQLHPKIRREKTQASGHKPHTVFNETVRTKVNNKSRRQLWQAASEEMRQEARSQVRAAMLKGSRNEALASLVPQASMSAQQVTRPLI